MAIEASDVCIRIVFLIGELVGVSVGKNVVVVVVSVISIFVEVAISIIVVSVQIVVGMIVVSTKITVSVSVGIIFRRIVVQFFFLGTFSRFMPIFTTIIANTFETLRILCFSIQCWSFISL